MPASARFCDYMKRMSSNKGESDGTFPSQSPAGDGWFKIMYNSTDSQDLWCTERLNHTSEGVLTTQIPSDIAPGYYLLRPELLALHNATRGDPQFYTGCAQVYISGGSGTAKPETVAIPGYVNYSQEAMLWNLYNQTGADYPEYGPKLYKSAKDNSAETPASSIQSSILATGSVQTSSTPSESNGVRVGTRPSCRNKRDQTKAIHNDGKEDLDVSNTEIDEHGSASSIPPSVLSCPSNTILELGNSCLPEVPHWLDEAGSRGMPNYWASQTFCWSVVTTCWKERSPAVSYLKGQGCNLYADRCKDIGTACKNSVQEGPPHEGASIAPEEARLTGLGVQG